MAWGGKRGLFRSMQVLPQLEAAPDLRRGETRLMAEVLMAELRGERVPLFASLKAHEVLSQVARS